MEDESPMRVQVPLLNSFINMKFNFNDLRRILSAPNERRRAFGDKRMVLDLEIKDYDYRPVRGLGKDRDELPIETKLLVLIRQRGLCAYCCVPIFFEVEGKKFCLYRGVNKRPGQLDHGIPVSQGGRDDVRTMCYLCRLS